MKTDWAAVLKHSSEIEELMAKGVPAQKALDTVINNLNAKRTKIIEEYKKKSREYDESNPSEATEGNWIPTSRKKGEYPKHTRNGGKWLIYVKRENIDKVWRNIKKATEDGLLGAGSKVSTAKETPYSKGNLHVICVYTYNYTDEADVRRVRNELRKLGVTEKIPYKRDSQKKYAVRGDKNISDYYE